MATLPPTPGTDFATAEFVARGGEWERLFDDLDAAGCELGVEGRLRLLGLADRLAAAGADLSDPDVLGAHLVPILARDSERAGELAEVIGDWRASPTVGGGWFRAAERQMPPEPTTVLRRADHGLRWFSLGLALTIALALVAFAISRATGPPPLSPSPGSDLRTHGGAFVADWPLLKDWATRAIFALPVLFFGFLFAGWRNAEGNRLARSTGEADWSELFTLVAKQLQWFSVTSPRRLFETLTLQRQESLAERIDVPKSVRATLCAGMAPAIVYKSGAESTNTVVLIDRRAAEDHIELFLHALTDALGAAKIRFAVYEFRARPAFCTPTIAGDRSEPALPMRLVAKRHAGERLLVVSDGEYFFEKPGWRFLRNRRRIFVRPGTRVAEMVNLRDFGHAALLTPTPQSVWGARERMLEDLGFLVAPLDAEGVLRIARDVATGGEEIANRLKSSASEDPFLALLSTRAMTFASDAPPPPEDIANLVTDIRIWLARTGADDLLRPGAAFLVLCGVAAFPTIVPGLTVEITRLLTQAPGGADPPIDSRFLTPLMRLPWLREGRMPDWLRIALLNALDEAEFKRIRVLQIALLNEAARSELGPIDLAGLKQIAATLEVAVGESDLDEAASRIAPDAPGQEVERIFLATLHGERLDPVRDVISPEAPEAMRQRLGRRERTRRLRWLFASIVAAGTTALAEPTLAAWIDAEWQRITSFVAAHPTSIMVAGFDIARWFGALSTVLAAISLATWLIAALRLRAAPAPRHFVLDGLRYWTLVPIAPAAAYVLVDPEAARMPLLFAVATPIFLWFAPRSQTAGVRSAADMLPERFEGDDWIATSLGSAAVALVALGPVLLFSLPRLEDPSTSFAVLIAAVLAGGTGWGLGSRWIRYQLLGPIDGRPTTNEDWLDFIAPTLSLLLLAAFMKPLVHLAAGVVYHNILSLAVVSMTGICFVYLTLRLKLGYQTLVRYILTWVLIASAGTMFAYGILPRNVAYICIIFPILFTIISITRSVVFMRYIIVSLLIVSYGSLVYWLIYLCLTLYESLASREFQPPEEYLVSIWIILGGAALFWPNLRFNLMSGYARNVPDETLLRWVLSGVRRALVSPWWFSIFILASALRYQAFGLDLDLTFLAMPLAVIAGWLCGKRAIIPVLVGSLPFIATFELRDLRLDLALPDLTLNSTAGGLWQVAVLPLLARVVADEALRGAIIGRLRSLPWDCALFVLCLATATPQLRIISGFALTVDPTWLVAAVGFIIGASRMRGREPLVAIAGFAVTGVLIGLNDVVQLSSLSAAAFFGGRMWRGVVLRESTGRRGIDARVAIVLMAGGIGAGYVGPSLGWTSSSPLLVRFVEASFALLAYVGGIVLRKSPGLSLGTVVIGLGAAGLLLVPFGANMSGGEFWFNLGGRFWSSIIWIVAFALLGYQIDRRGDAAYGRALGVLLLPNKPLPSSPVAVAAPA